MYNVTTVKDKQNKYFQGGLINIVYLQMNNTVKNIPHEAMNQTCQFSEIPKFINVIYV